MYVYFFSTCLLHGLILDKKVFVFTFLYFLCTRDNKSVFLDADR